MEKECSNEQDKSAVCGDNGRTYASMCELRRNRIALAYEGHCRPSECQEPVCGVDMNSYSSACHAHSRNVVINHIGRCFLPMQVNAG